MLKRFASVLISVILIAISSLLATTGEAHAGRVTNPAPTTQPRAILRRHQPAPHPGVILGCRPSAVNAACETGELAVR